MNPRNASSIRVVLAVELIAVAVFALLYDSLDFRIYLLGGHAVGHGDSLYADQFAGHWFTNTPFFALLCAPLSALPTALVRLTWQLASVAAFGYACRTALALAGYRPTRTATAGVLAAGLLLEPVYHTLFQGQVNLFLLALVLADVRRIAAGRRAGIGIGLAAAIKVTPAIFVLWLLVSRRGRDAGTAAATFAGCVLLGFLAAPVDSWRYWLHTFYDTGRVGASYISNQSPYAALLRVFGPDARIGHWYLLVPLAIGVLGLATAAARSRRGDWLGAAAATGTTGLLVSPISWAHHWVWVLPALVLLVRDGRRVAAAGGYVLFVLAPMWWTPHDGAAGEYGLHGLLTPVANCYLLAGVAFLGYLAATTGGLNRAPDGHESRHDRLAVPGGARPGRAVERT